MDPAIDMVFLTRFDSNGAFVLSGGLIRLGSVPIGGTADVATHRSVALRRAPARERPPSLEETLIHESCRAPTIFVPTAMISPSAAIG